jgi:hypothetical protein
MEMLTPVDYNALQRQDFCAFGPRCFYELNPQARFLWNWHIEVMAAKLAACHRGKIRRLIINVPPRHLKSLCASIALPAWWLGHDPTAQIICVSYGQELSDKHARDCRAVMTSAFYQRLLPAPFSHPSVPAEAVRPGICDDPPGLSLRRLGGRRSDWSRWRRHYH